ncbi:uncharacterized protein FFUJ_03835 [Fusarium fujikuroi IMI 58289]|uniref:C2H2-type domain-containing protein n=1 Tax=Gibberella fujikuroi (strain CBS 195.34 / IMI 58289 / NRRL A-6831) TaxID=1279085 RepID=S0DWN7_GIBF5|nr:uncharacterized protein FFUJ_03835 [Fusarium fujikuroi IMI 58289]CCT64903.1 uncharacterized protein FFUJ_03835 [Fusarium fujikuroi IMI 58289]SCN89986.1 uncharacterized protein FFM5_04846 [Fusarium fujikuroi]
MPYLDQYSPLYSYAGGSTRTGVGGLRAAEHLGRALAEVDGLFAGFTHLDETEPESRNSRPSSGHDDLALELDSLCNTAPTNSTPDSQPDSANPRNQARENAWASIRTVREGMQILWEHFVDVSYDVNLPTINNIRAEYHDSRGLRQAGVFAFRNTLTGPAPNDLVKIFAFCSLSYVVSRLLYSRGRLAEGDILAGIRLWLNALEDEDERKALEVLARRLWPEARNHLHFIDLNMGEQSRKLATSLQRAETPFSAPPTQTYPVLPLASLGPQTQSMYEQPAPAYSHELGNSHHLAVAPDLGTIDPGLLNMLATDISPVYIDNLTDRTYEEFNFSVALPETHSQVPGPGPNLWHGFDPGPVQPPHLDVGAMGGITPWSAMPQSNACSPIASTSSHDSRSQSLSSTQTAGDILASLQGTSVFTAVLDYIREHGGFWFKLAGCGLVSKDFRSRLAWSQERLRKRKLIEASYMQPLSSEKYTRDLPARGIVSVVEAFFDQGLLQSIEDIKSYMERVASLLFSDRVACQEFRDWVHVVQGTPKPSTSTPVPNAKLKHLSCPKCDYTSDRSYNIERHSKTHEKNEEHNKKKSRKS